MNSSPLPSRAPDAAAMALAGRLLGQSVLAAWPVPRGGNNRIFLVDAGSVCYALKQYPRQAGDTRDRLGTEYGAIELLHGAGFRDIPAPVACNVAEGAALYEWIDGAPVDEVGAADIDAALDMLGRLAALSDSGTGRDLAPASAACFSPADVLMQVETRFNRLGQALPNPPAALRAYLDDEFAAIHHILAEAAEHACQRAGIARDVALRPDQRLLSPSDFGFHNALRQPDGGIVFVDLEYFGWDDPAKLVLDFLTHPGHVLKPALAQRFEAGAVALLGVRDPQFAERLAALRPLISLTWCLILLNEFLPDTVVRRGLGVREAEAAQAAQLARSRDLLMRLWRRYESCQPAS